MEGGVEGAKVENDRGLCAHVTKSCIHSVFTFSQARNTKDGIWMLCF